MCGLFGIYYGPAGVKGEPWSPTDLMQIMYPEIIHRGRHAWGYMYREHDSNTVEWFKKAGSAVKKDAPADMVLPEDLDLSYLSCHVRYYTNGTPNNPANNHPIVHGDIIGMHNGKLREWQPILDELGREDPTAQVDSEAIFAAVNAYDVKDGLRRIKGDMVSVFTDLKNPSILWFARTDDRPLVYGFTEAGSFIWASEAAVIEATGIPIQGKLINWTDTNRVMAVENGTIIRRFQFRKAEPKPEPRKWLPPAQVPPFGYPTGTILGASKPDKYGGCYIGAGMYRVTLEDGSTKNLDAHEYIDWIVPREVQKELDRRATAIKQSRDRAQAVKSAQAPKPGPKPGPHIAPRPALPPAAPTQSPEPERVRITA